MKEAVVTVESNDHNSRPPHLGSTEPGSDRPTPAPGGRFTYASGDCPLAGYAIKRGIGHGGFGEVYYATSEAGKEVALKLIRRNLEVELRGIRHCLNLKHPNLLSLYDIREDAQGDSWVVMEYITGDCLQDVVAAHPNGMPVAQALGWFHGIGAGVACLHDHGIVHRDLKPGNIFSDEGIVKIGDYGLSKYISCSRRSGQTESVGTVHYMAPEVANGRYGKEIDIYAMGIILYEMLTGRVPFEGESVGEVLMKHLTATADVSMLAEPFRSVVAKALEKDPVRRFASVAEMLAGLPCPSRPQGHAGPMPATGPTLGSARGATGGPCVASISADETADGEPIWRAIRRMTKQVYVAWSESKLNTPTKILLLCVGLFVFLASAHSLVPLMMLLTMLYGCYWVARAIILALGPGQKPTLLTPVGPLPMRSTPSQQAQVPISSGAPAAGQRSSSTLPKWYRGAEKPAEALVLKSPRERATELIGSLLGGALVALTMSLVMVILASFQSQTLLQPNQCAWLALVGIAGTWAVMIPSKFWEGSRGDPVLRRFILMVVGLALGVVAFGAAELLTVKLPYDPRLPAADVYRLPPSFYDVRDPDRPLLMAHMACFGTLFLLLRWWRQADPLRKARMQLWTMLVAVLVAWLTAAVWLFPQSWLIMVACVISVSVQLGSPWLHPRSRSQDAGPGRTVR